MYNYHNSLSYLFLFNSTSVFCQIFVIYLMSPLLLTFHRIFYIFQPELWNIWKNIFSKMSFILLNEQDLFISFACTCCHISKQNLCELLLKTISLVFQLKLFKDNLFRMFIAYRYIVYFDVKIFVKYKLLILAKSPLDPKSWCAY